MVRGVGQQSPLSDCTEPRTSRDPRAARRLNFVTQLSCSKTAERAATLESDEMREACDSPARCIAVTEQCNVTFIAVDLRLCDCGVTH